MKTLKQRQTRRFTACLTARLLCVTALAMSTGSAPLAAEATRVQPVASQDNFELFQTLVVMHSLSKLGLEVQTPKRVPQIKLFESVADGSAHFMASLLDPQNSSSFEAAGGESKLEKSKPVIGEIRRGFMTDVASTLRFKLTDMEQLKDPKLAKRFDRNGNGTADLIGCPENSKCAKAIDAKLSQFGLTRTVEQIHGDYNEMMTETVQLARELQPVLYYAIEPSWVSGARIPGKHAIWLAPPDSDDSGSSTGFKTNKLRIVSNSAFLAKNPVVAELLNLIRIEPQDLSKQNLQVQLGENSRADIERHARQWLSQNEKLVDKWIREAKKIVGQK